MNKRQHVSKVCYMCDKPATSREHAPPKCFFPRAKDVNSGKNYRRNLITVPSCDEHNISKSANDLDTALILQLSTWSNNFGAEIFNNRVSDAALRLRPFISKLQANSRAVHDGKNCGVVFSLDRSQIESHMSMMGRALYFHTTGQKWLGPINVLVPSMVVDNTLEGRTYIKEQHKVICTTINHMRDMPKLGENQEIFWYKILTLESGEIIALMCFYEHMPIIATSSRETIK